MEISRFTALTRAVFGSRRDVLRGLGSAGLGLGAWQLPNQASAKKKRKRKKVQTAATPNEFGCISVGGHCQGAGQCCSGSCVGSDGEKTCRAHHTGTCHQGGAGYCIDRDPSREACDGSLECFCARTTAGSDACVAYAPSGTDFCTDCARDSDCEAIGYPAGSVCLPLHEGICVGACASNRACFPPCGVDWPVM